MVTKLGSEKAAIAMMSKDPSLMLCDRYDGLSPKLEAMLTPDEIRVGANSGGGGGGGVATPVILGGVGLVAVAALAATGSGPFGP